MKKISFFRKKAIIRLLTLSILVCCLIGSSIPFKINALSVAEPNTLKDYDIQTPRGEYIQAYYVTGEHSAFYLDFLDRSAADSYPSATMISPATGKYNCHSWAWYFQSSLNHYWINAYTTSYNNNLSKYWNDGSYSLVIITQGSVPTNSNGYKIVYFDSPQFFYNHSAIVKNSSSGVARSKWGPAGVYEHSITDCPYYHNGATNLAYFKYNKIP